jgi:hypothetical protein
LVDGSSQGNDGGMRQPPNPHYRHRFPAELISHAVWLYHVFTADWKAAMGKLSKPIAPYRTIVEIFQISP